MGPIENNVAINSDQEETTEQRWNRMISDLVRKNGWSPGKAVRYLNAMSRREIKKHTQQKGNKVARNIFKRYAYIPVNARQLERIEQQKRYSEQAMTQIENQKINTPIPSDIETIS